MEKPKLPAPPPIEYPSDDKKDAGKEPKTPWLVELLEEYDARKDIHKNIRQEKAELRKKALQQKIGRTASRLLVELKGMNETTPRDSTDKMIEADELNERFWSEADYYKDKTALQFRKLGFIALNTPGLKSITRPIQSGMVNRRIAKKDRQEYLSRNSLRAQVSTAARHYDLLFEGPTKELDKRRKELDGESPDGAVDPSDTYSI